MTLSEQYKECISRLSASYEKHEAESISRILFCHILKCNFSELTLALNAAYSPLLIAEVEQCMQRLLNHEPVQYVTGVVYFDNLKLYVNKHVLIPRPETEELVIKINGLLKNITQPYVIDFCTGSGCMALGIKHQLKYANVVGIDISPEAIHVALENAQLNKCQIDFFVDDIFNYGNKLKVAMQNANVFVSNPPYVTIDDKELMHKNVLDYEPHLALFDYSNDSLSFYRQLATLMKQAPKLRLAAFEINEKKGKEMLELFSNQGFENCKIEKDIVGKERFIIIQCNNELTTNF
ncbi:MAG: peptide chain release factor N(5)-glutamine methyltransferase [Bacteroidetes bacterium]|nr:peptide chain release factor N(5)-glutamine methyltransferase [Bacteroidota bacterium]